MDVYQVKVANLLAREYLFMGLDETQLMHIASLFQPVRVRKGRILFRRGDLGGYFYIIYEGRVSILKEHHRGHIHEYTLYPGDFFGERELLRRLRRANTAKALEDAVLLRIGQAGFDHLLGEFPHMRPILQATSRSRALAHRQDFSWLREGETLHLVKRKHLVFLLISLMLPALLGGLSLLSIFYALLSLELPGIELFFFGGSLGLIIALLWGLWRWANWENDYFVVTNWRVAWLEKVIWLYESRLEARLDQVQSSAVTRPFWGRYLDYGTIRINTYTGKIAMSRVRKPALIAAYVEALKERTKVVSVEAERQQKQDELEQVYADQDSPPREGDIRLVRGPAKKPAKKRSGTFGALRTFLSLRFEQDGVITYRKHWFVLLRKSLLPLVLLLVLLALTIALQVDGSLSHLDWVGKLLLGGSYLGVLGWLLYTYLDWSNDRYQITPELIRELERKPLGEELINSARLENILSIEHARGSFINILFDFGTVSINVGDRHFTFNDVKDPNRAHQDIANYQDAFNERKREKARKQVHDEMKDWFLADRAIDKSP